MIPRNHSLLSKTILRSLFTLLEVLLVFLCWLHNARTHQHSIKHIKDVGGDVMYQWQWTNGKSVAVEVSRPLRWLIDTIGPEYFGDVTWVDLSLTASDDLLKEIAVFTNLEYLNLNGSPVTDSGLKHISTLPHLLELNLGGTQIKGMGLSNLRTMHNLESLDLSFSKAEDQGVAQLTHLEHLKYLNLAHTDITDGCIDDLLKLTTLRVINLVDVVETRSTRSFRDFSNAPPDPKVQGLINRSSIPFKKRLSQKSLMKLRNLSPQLEIQY